MSVKKSKLYRIFKIDVEKIRRSENSSIITVDFFMLFLVAVNLGGIIFDWAWGWNFFSGLWKHFIPGFYHWYEQYIHPNTNIIDLVFVTIFVIELSLRWLWAIYKKTYFRWFYYPFIHWYDVLGCIPLNGTFRLFRLLRIFGLFYRLQRLGVIDITKTFIYEQSAKYLDIIIEEISDRVVVKVLDGVQDEIQTGNPIVEKVTREVLIPKSEIISEWLSERVSNAITLTYTQHQTELHQYVKDLITRAVKENREVENIKLIPGVGKLIANTLDHAISDITFNVVDNMMEDLEKAKNKRGIEEITTAVMNSILFSKEGEGIKVSMITGVANEVIEVVKSQVKEKQWKLKVPDVSK